MCNTAFTKVNVDILQFYSMVKTERILTNEDLQKLGDYGLKSDQRKELKSLLYGIFAIFLQLAKFFKS